MEESILTKIVLQKDIWFFATECFSKNCFWIFGLSMIPEVVTLTFKNAFNCEQTDSIKHV